MILDIEKELRTIDQSKKVHIVLKNYQGNYISDVQDICARLMTTSGGGRGQRDVFKAKLKQRVIHCLDNGGTVTFTIQP